jgi:hypothetical protein
LPPSPLLPSIDFIFLPILSLAIFALLSLQSLTLFFDFSKTLKQSLDFFFHFQIVSFSLSFDIPDNDGTEWSYNTHSGSDSP